MADRKIGTPEEWRAVVGFEGYYEASNLGRVRSLPRKTRGGWKGEWISPGRVLAQREINSGYLRVCLCVNDERTYHLVHALVAFAFHGEPPGEHGIGGKDAWHVDHINGNRKDNRAANLRWQEYHANVGGIVTPKEVREIRALYAKGGITHREIGERYGLTRRAVGRICDRSNWAHVK